MRTICAIGVDHTNRRSSLDPTPASPVHRRHAENLDVRVRNSWDRVHLARQILSAGANRDGELRIRHGCARLPLSARRCDKQLNLFLFLESNAYRPFIEIGLRTVSSFMPEHFTGPNAAAPEGMTPQERIAEIAQILAGGLMRLRGRKSSPISAAGGESLLDCAAHQSGHADSLKSHGASK
jgi:hypothetical protein